MRGSPAGERVVDDVVIVLAAADLMKRVNLGRLVITLSESSDDPDERGEQARREPIGVSVVLTALRAGKVIFDLRCGRQN